MRYILNCEDYITSCMIYESLVKEFNLPKEEVEGEDGIFDPDQGFIYLGLFLSKEDKYNISSVKHCVNGINLKEFREVIKKHRKNIIKF